MAAECMALNYLTVKSSIPGSGECSFFLKKKKCLFGCVGSSLGSVESSLARGGSSVAALGLSVPCPDSVFVVRGLRCSVTHGVLVPQPRIEPGCLFYRKADC